MAVIRVGDRIAHDFVVDEAAMRTFASVSGDDSRIHTSPAFARQRGYTDVIVYGGIMLSHLSRVLGTKLPGANGTSTKWAINYRQPLYVGEEARLELEVTHTSPAAGVVETKFRITVADKVVATGQTQSLVPREEIE